MSLDRHAAERRRFARLLGTDDEYGSGLPIGRREDGVAEQADEEDEQPADDGDRGCSSEEADPVRKSRAR
ncbi:hypothetical protein [Natrinema halophilum]|uniref:Uncharacterized protein n=1 Tax=Natrinema halophilum TaxID=1699371 RepID=A0A7D5GPG2_9EURY|nr:hypothetical protein [Natrinema halophilum]QLG50393.1 hypothetical protein HYG82_16835 [Natrinema halophilum]